MVINKDSFRTEFIVRDYECDLQGIVNNANYQHYFEHARHQFLLSRGISFASLHDEGIDLIVIRVEIDYKYPLRSRDRFYATVTVEREGNARLLFRQEIMRSDDNKLVAKAKISGVASRRGKPVPPPGEILDKLGLA
jgi:acyl-CoA thioester hydrolase